MAIRSLSKSASFLSKLVITLTFSLFYLFSSFNTVYAYEEDEKIISGAGAHFAWTIFDALKLDLEETVNRKIKLYGKNSMLGQGCNAGIKTAKRNSPNYESFGFICCPLSEKEIKKEGLIVYPIALEPVVIMVNKENPIRNLTTEQIHSIFSGKIKNWSEVGGTNEPIVVITRLHCKKRPGHWKTILPNHKLFRQKRLNVSSSAEMVQRISDFTWSIGHTGSTWVREPNLNVKQITIDNVEATAKSLEEKRYPFYRPLSAITNQTPSEDILKIIKEVQTGPAFRQVAKKYELLPTNNSN